MITLEGKEGRPSRNSLGPPGQSQVGRTENVGLNLGDRAK